jgi:acid phosphatase type 7
VGDIATCDGDADAATAAIVARLRPYAVLTLGDNAYPNASAADYANCYAPTWGPFLSGTHPAPGNHEYHSPGAETYFAYFGAQAPGEYYSLDLGEWHVVSLNSEIPRDPASEQVRWLRADLASDGNRCEILYWHKPRWAGGEYGSDPSMQTLWEVAYEHGVDLVLVGHEHSYQRFAPLDASGEPDAAFGVRQVVAGTGGAPLYAVGTAPHREVANGETYGVLELLLRPTGYDLSFVPAGDGTFTDALVDVPCHGAPPAR